MKSIRFTRPVAAIILLLILFAAAGFAQEHSPDVPLPVLLRAARADLAPVPAEAPYVMVPAWSEIQPALAIESPGRKSPFLAGGLSLLVPGAGEVYAEAYWIAPIFLAAEAVGWYFVVDYNRQGDDATTRFEAFADEHWSAVKYAEWLNAYAKNFQGGENAKPIPIDPNPALPPWERVGWIQMNETEAMIPQFSHRLPRHGEQQYYELIGKYNQYSYGWDDKLPNGGDGWSDYREISPRYRSYSGMRGHANELYESATTVVNLLILNHALSALDAAWAASRYNKDLEFHSSVRLRHLPSGGSELVPTASFRVRL